MAVSQHRYLVINKSTALQCREVTPCIVETEA